MTDEELCRAILETEQGKADALGGGVFKKRLHRNRERAIILAKGGSNWFYTFLYLELSNQVQRFFEVNFIRCFPT
ncbi:hypothetical protein DM870_22870 [Escherichia coli]|nr:hypothetical protein DM870_22870 [Escherichia coli]